MVGHSGPLYRLPWLALVGLLIPLSVQGQGRWVVDSRSSLAWWQMSPNLNHLWATTCPSDRNWRPGESRSSGWHINPRLKLPNYGYGNVEDTVHVPLFPRDTVRPGCVQAVRGEVVVADSVHWTGVHGMIAVESDALYTGEQMRDVMMHQALESAQYPEMQFTLDSLVGVTKQGDTLRASAVGTFLLRDIPTPSVAAVQVFPVAGGLRVLAKWHIPAKDLKQLTPLIHRLGLGLNTQLWKTCFMGADIVFRPAGAREQ